MSEIILITSGKGGTGKSTVTAGLGLALAKRGKKVCMIDANIGMRDLDFICGLADRVFYNLHDLVVRGSKIQKALLHVPIEEELYLIPAPQTKSTADFDRDKFVAILEELQKQFDFILIDCPPGAGEGFELVSSRCNAAILVVNPDASSLRAADKIRTILKRRHMFRIYLCVNRFPDQFQEDTPYMKPEEIAEIVPEELCGFLLTDPAMARAWMKEEITGLLDSENQSAWLTMADLLCGEEVSVHVPDAGNEEPAEQSPDADEESSEIFDEPIFLDQKTNNELVPYTPPVQKSLWARIFGL